jgi:hypothetical protein
MPTADRLLGFTGTIDITSVLGAQNSAVLAVKIDRQAWQEKTVNFSAATPAALTVDAAVSVLNAAGFTGVIFEKDPGTGRLNMKASSVVTFPITWIEAGKERTILMYKTETQIYGDLAGALDFGQCRQNGGKDTTGWKFEQKETLSRRCKDLELFMGFILPDNTFDFLTSWARGNNLTDIKKLSDKQLLDAAILAERGNTVPHEFIQGVFAEHSKQDIDLRAWTLLDEARKNKRRLNEIPEFRRNRTHAPPHLRRPSR